VHSRTTTSIARPGFTLLETVLAAVMGALFVLLTVGFMYAMQRSDIAMARRAEEAGDLQRARLVMQRCFSTILTSEQPRPDARGDIRRGAARNRQPDPKAEAADGEAPREETPPPPPRVILATQDGRSAPPIRLASGEWSSTTPQRLELVVFESPVPKSVREARASVRQRRALEESEIPEASETLAPGEGGALNDPETADPEEPDDDDMPLKAIRGALELRAQPRLDPDAPANQQSSYELWWVPVARRAPADAIIDEALQAELATVDRPYRVASNIAMARWVMFDDREKKTNFEATWDSQLPAYIECQIETTTGLRSEWMFEVGWGVGPEVRLPKPEDTGGKSGENRAVPVEGSSGSPPGSVGSPPGSGGPPGRGSPGRGSGSSGSGSGGGDSKGGKGGGSKGGK